MFRSLIVRPSNQAIELPSNITIGLDNRILLFSDVPFL